MEKCLLSVIIPTFRTQDYLWECLASLERQSLSHTFFEVIVVLNGPKEPYWSELSAYQQAHPAMNLRCLYADKTGAASARNAGLEVACGQFVTFLDDDDYLSDSCLEEMLSLSTEEYIVACYPYSFQDGMAEKQCPYTMTDAYDYCTRHQCTSLHSIARLYLSGPCMKLIARDMIGDRRFNPTFTVGEDSLFMFLISDRIKGILFTSRQAVYYRRLRAGSTIHSQSVLHSIQTGIRLAVAYTKLFFTGRYSWYLYVTRLLGACHRILYCLK